MTAQEEVERILRIARGRIAYIEAISDKNTSLAECITKANEAWWGLLKYGLSPFVVKEMAEAWLKIEQLEQQIKDLKEAIKPFASIPPVLISDNEHIHAVCYWCVIGHPGKVHFTIEDLKRAKAASGLARDEGRECVRQEKERARAASRDPEIKLV